MELHLPKQQQLQLTAMALRAQRSPDEILAEAVERMAADEEWFARQVQTGIDEIGRGEFLSEEEMDRHVERMLGA